MKTGQKIIIILLFVICGCRSVSPDDFSQVEHRVTNLDDRETIAIIFENHMGERTNPLTVSNSSLKVGSRSEQLDEQTKIRLISLLGRIERGEDLSTCLHKGNLELKFYDETGLLVSTHKAPFGLCRRLDLLLFGHIDDKIGWLTGK